MSDKLMPCPFCGSNHLELDCGSVTESLGGFYLQSGEIECMKCGVSGPSVDASNEKDDLNALAASAWNARAPQAGSGDKKTLNELFHATTSPLPSTDSVTISREDAEYAELALAERLDRQERMGAVAGRTIKALTNIKQALKP